jgi:hypothetical protein
MRTAILVQPLRNSEKNPTVHIKNTKAHIMYIFCVILPGMSQSAHTFDCPPGCYPVSRAIH